MQPPSFRHKSVPKPGREKRHGGQLHMYMPHAAYLFIEPAN